MPAAPPRPLRWLPFALFAVLAVAILGGWFYAVDSARTHGRRVDELIAEQTRLRISDWAKTRLAFLRSLRSLAEAGLYDRDGAWSERITYLIEQLGGFQAVNWIDAEGTIRRIAPVAGNEPALGRNVLAHPVVGATLAEAIRVVHTRISPPIDLYQGGRGFTAYVPVRAGGRPDGPLIGLVNGVFRTDHLAAACVDALAPSHDVRLADGDRILVETADFPPGAAPRTTATLEIADRTWTLTIHPRVPPVAMTFSLALLGLALGLAAGLAWILNLALARQAEAGHAQAERAHLAARLRAAERLEAMGHLAGGVAHDFNNLLTVIQGRADLLADTLDDAPDDRDALIDSVDAIRDAATRAASVTSQLLAFARREPVSTGIVDLTAHLRAVAPMLENLATEAVALKLDLPDEPLWTACPPGVVDRILVNLVANARDATAPNGTVAITLSAAPPFTLLTVADDGRGMPPEVLARAFEPFFTTRTTGSGLGLATVYGLVTQRGGTIDADSEVGRGTTFQIRLPAAPAPPLPAPASATSRAGSSPRPAATRVVVVEDNGPVRAVVVRALHGAGFDVTDFPDGESALAAAPHADVLVTDLVLPGLDGVAVAERLRAARPDLAVVVMSGYSDEPGAVDASLAQGARFLAKPFQMADLIALVRELEPPRTGRGARPPATFPTPTR